MRPVHAILAALLAAIPAQAGAWATESQGAQAAAGLPVDKHGREKYDAGWSLALDNDLLSLGNRDYDYTGGLAVTFAGRRAAEWPVSLDRFTGWLDPLVPDRTTNAPRFTLHALQIGVIAFTPDDLNNPEPVRDDRPYASLLFASNARTFVSHPAAPVYETAFTVGFLGLDVAKHLQRTIHEGLGLSEVPEGWDHQISDGGEPTLRATLGRQALLATGAAPRGTAYDIKWRAEGSLGYLTEASVALTGRWGRIATPWWSFTPERTDYILQAAPVIGSPPGASRRELYIWSALKLRAVGYNAFLQGQFRDSEVTIPAGDMERLVAEASAGLTWQMSGAYRLGYAVRFQTREYEGNAARDLLWAGLILSRDL